jgi:hypothetical protein
MHPGSVNVTAPGIGRLPDVEGDKPAKKKFESYPN